MILCTLIHVKKSKPNTVVQYQNPYRLIYTNHPQMEFSQKFTQPFENVMHSP